MDFADKILFVDDENNILESIARQRMKWFTDPSTIRKLSKAYNTLPPISIFENLYKYNLQRLVVSMVEKEKFSCDNLLSSI
jgi:hypothetical protein